MKHACVGLLSTNTFWPQRHERLPETHRDSLRLLLCSFSCCCTVSFGCFGALLMTGARAAWQGQNFCYIFLLTLMWPSSMSASWTVDRQTMDTLGATHTCANTHTLRERERLLHTHNPGYKLRLLNLIAQRHTVTELQPVHCCSRCCLPHCLQFWAFRKRPKKKPQQACLRGAWAWALRARRNLQKRPKVKSELMSTKWSHL